MVEKEQIINQITKKILLADGAMGTYYVQKYPSAVEVEEANLIYPEQIIAIHKEYLEAGAQLIRTNTFAVNHCLFPDEAERRNVICQAVSNAREAVAQTGKECIIAGSIGPIRQSLEETHDDLMREYKEIIDIFFAEGIQVILFETFFDIRVIPELASYCKERNPHSIVMAQFSVNPMGYTQYGISVEEIICEMSANEEVDILGFNCGVGATHLKRLLSGQQFPRECLISVFPNAGYQQELRGRQRYENNPEYYAGQMKEIISTGANIIGGCCGTTPEHIIALRELLDKQDAVQSKKVVLSVNQEKNSKPVHLTPFMEKLQAGKEKVFVVELDAPFDSSVDKFTKGIYALKENNVDIVTVSDSPLGRPRADASLLAVYAKKCTDIMIMPHVAMRDRNLIGLRSEILGAYVNEIRDFLVVTGDPIGPDDRGKITGVFDMNSIRFMDYLKQMNAEIFGENPIFYGGALNYAGVNINAIAKRMCNKMDAGCSYFLTQPVFTEEDVVRIKELKQMTGAKIICGIMPLVGYRNAMFIKNEMPGIHVSDEIAALYRPDMTREEAEDVAVALSVDIAEKIYDVTDGFYLMTPFHRVGLINRIIDGIRKIVP